MPFQAFGCLPSEALKGQHLFPGTLSLLRALRTAGAALEGLVTLGEAGKASLEGNQEAGGGAPPLFLPPLQSLRVC